MKATDSRMLCVMWLLLVAAACTGVGDEVVQPATTKPTSLAQYYGFGAMEILKLEWGVGEPIIADINHDGLNDLILTNNRKARIELLLQKKDFDPTRKDLSTPAGDEDEDVNDIFGKERNWRFKRVSYPLDVAASSLVVADLNNDNRLDLAYYAKDGLYVALQGAPVKRAKTASVPTEPAWLPVKKIDIREGLAGGRALVAGDINGDKRSDLSLLAGDGVFLIVQQKDGSLAQPVKHPTGGQNARQHHVADVDGDGRADLVMLTGQREYPVRVRFQNDQGQLGPEIRYELPAPDVFELARLDKSTREYLITVSSGSGRTRISTLQPNPDPASYPVYNYPLPATENADKRNVVAADLDGNDQLEVVVSDPGKAEFLLFRAGKGGLLGTPQRFGGLMEMSKLVAGDLDGKGRDSIVALSLKEKLIAVSRLAKGRLSFPTSVAITGEPLAMDLADVDGDKKLDLIYVARDKKTKKHHLRTLLSLGRNKSAEGPQVELTELADKPLDLRAADIDGDGRTDAMILRPYGPMLLVRQAEAGKFTQAPTQGTNSGLVMDVTAGSLALADLGPKGRPAALVTRKNFARALVFDAKKGWQVVDQYSADDERARLTAAAAGILRRKAPLTIFTYDSASGKLGILTAQEDGTYRTTGQVEVGSISVKRMLVGNFGGPSAVSTLLCGTNELVMVPVSGQTRVLGKLASFEPDIKQGRFGALAVGDINDDGCPDIVLSEQARHHVQILTFDTEAKLTTAVKFKVFEQPRGGQRPQFGNSRSRGGEPRAVVLGDVTNDKKPDLILLTHDRIIIYPQD